MRGDAEKAAFVKEMDALCGHRNRWEIWHDMVHMFAISISNAVDGRHRDAREARYMAIAKRYSAEEMNAFAALFARMVNVYEVCGHMDFMGEIFMELGLGNDRGGQFFTPYDVCKIMAKVSIDSAPQGIERNGYISINDCACGAGATLIAAADILWNDQKINYQQTVMFTGQDIDETTALMCYIQFSLLGCAGYVHIGDTLTEPMTGHVLFGDGGENTWYTPMYFSEVWEIRRQAAILRHALGLPERAELEPSETPEVPKPEPDHEPKIPVIDVHGKKCRRKPEGQLMFEF